MDKNIIDRLVVLHDSDDLFKAPDITAEQPESMTELTEVATLFCDSSGFGEPGEPALTIDQAKDKASELIKEHGKGNLVAGLTGIGPFQVHLTIFKNTNV